jgi:excisionase family DNA binding protein
MRSKANHKGSTTLLSEPFYTVREAATETRLSEWTIWDMLKTGRLMRTKVGGKTFVRESELRKLIVDSVNEPKRGKKAAV